jgi:hypothetical protein
MEPHKHFYFLSSKYNDQGDGIVVVASSARRAKASNYHYLEELNEYLDLRCRRLEQEVPKDMDYGVVDTWRGLFLQVYGWIYEDCPFCKKCDEYRLDDETETICICPNCKKEIKLSDTKEKK